MSPKHLAEFWMLELEESFINDLDQLLDRIESLCKFLSFYLERHSKEDLDYLREQSGNYEHGQRLSMGTYVRITHQEAVDILEQTEQFSTIRSETVNLNAQMERKLVELMGNRPVFVTEYPASIKPFYMKKNSNDKALCFDLLMPVCGEVCGGSLREDNSYVDSVMFQLVGLGLVLIDFCNH
ncbi:hypothetical protein RDWZM_007894 [Blomia tropicalis]|uniref:Aminoacyl-tRNA synthetase class II (D/K/N) domain-containing protein n=1 Tax=Blomia tropicalis TaxID=40697 RepID=A0A9Q0M3C7_BLOTA|nr:hypothetical protein RDWZM_007894 [Blomia tropicalis]